MPNVERNQGSWSDRLKTLAHHIRLQDAKGKAKRVAKKEAWRQMSLFAKVRHAGKRSATFLVGAGTAFVLVAMISVWGIIQFRIFEGFEGAPFEGQETIHDAVIISSDPGGRVTDRIAHVSWLEKRKMRVQVEGMCASACTMYLGMENTCAMPESVWMFHRARVISESPIVHIIGYPLSFMIDDFGESRLPVDFRDWISESVSGMTLEEGLWIPGEDLIEAGWVKACETDRHTEKVGSMEKIRHFTTRMTGDFTPPRPMPVRNEVLGKSAP